MQHVFFYSSSPILKDLSTFTGSIIGVVSPLQKGVLEVFSVPLKEEVHNVIPNFLRFKVANATLCTSLTYKRCQKKLLPEEIYNIQ